jgi:hypothetical protein
MKPVAQRVNQKHPELLQNDDGTLSNVLGHNR